MSDKPISIPDDPVWATNHVLLPYGQYEELRLLKQRAKEKLVQLREDASSRGLKQESYIECLAWLLGEPAW